MVWSATWVHPLVTTVIPWKKTQTRRLADVMVVRPMVIGVPHQTSGEAPPTVTITTANLMDKNGKSAATVANTIDPHVVDRDTNVDGQSQDRVDVPMHRTTITDLLLAITACHNKT